MKKMMALIVALGLLLLPQLALAGETVTTLGMTDSAVGAIALIFFVFAYLLMFLTTAVVVLLGLPLATDAVGNVVASRGNSARWMSG